MLKKSKLAAVLAGVLFSGYLYAAEPYDSSKSYSGGSQVSLNDKLYEAKWWANPGQSPTDDYANDWDSPWKLIGDTDPTPGPGPEPGPEPGPGPGDVTPFIPGQTQVNNGDMVSYNGECFIAKNSPGTWETPSASSWFWDLVDCPDDGNGPIDPPIDPPQLEFSIVSPNNNDSLELNQNTSITTRIVGGGAEKVEFWVNNGKFGEQNVEKSKELYSQSWTPTEVGSAAISVYVYAADNKLIEQQSVNVNVFEEEELPSAPEVRFISPNNGSTFDVPATVAIAVQATDKDENLVSVVVKANNQQICEFDARTETEFACNWNATTPGNVTLETIAIDDSDLAARASIQITINEEEITPPPPPPPTGELCDDFNVYPDWTRGDHASNGDIMVHNNIAYEAIYWTQSTPGSDGSWNHHVNCDGTPPGTAPLLSLPNPLDPVRLEVAGWPNHLVVASPSTAAPSSIVIDTVNSDEIADLAKLTSSFVALIEASKNAATSSIIIKGDVLDKATMDKGQGLGSVAVKQALVQAIDITGANIDIDEVNTLTNDAKGWAQAYNLVISTVAPQATFGWTVSIGDFAYNKHSGRQSVWDSASQYSADMLNDFELYDLESSYKADFLVYTKSSETPALDGEQWHNALEYVKQVSDYVKTPVMLADIPTAQAAQYFMGKTTAERQLRKAAFSNVFAIKFDQNSSELTSKIEEYQGAQVPLYYAGDGSHEGPLTAIEELNRQLIAAEDVMNNQAFLFETPQSQWIPSTVYKWQDFLDGLSAMHNIGVAGNKFWLIDENADEETNIKYAKVAIAAFLAQSMQETIRYNACDENNWSESRWGAPTDYPMAASCGQLGQRYADYGVNPISGLDHAYSCPRNDKMEVSALTHAQWYGAPAPVFAAPDAVLEERGLLVNGFAGRWTNNGHCNEVPETVDTSKQVWERDECKVYVGQKAGTFLWDGSSQESVQGCGWWGRGVIQTTGRQNFGTLNHYLGRSHVDPSTIGQTIDGLTVEAPPTNPLYAELDFCSNPGLICSSEKNKEIKWIAGLFYWVTSVQAYPDESGLYPGWNYHNELKKYVDGGMKGTQFIDDVSGIVNRGCPDLTCDTGDVHNVEERRDNFNKVLTLLGLNPQ
ncbi:Ig-like domain-containing protein [Vibrio aestuarianus]|uniref:Ig-like domain-containing protein n=1 Tax=Vibrio aestuarianus TaxID=28171 RepID=A0A9X4F2E1_9VIBR|nr:Ig-like domain-containing protein [Vibrio aestuarianus]MDE1243109.1 Ig-like domain-containing protein [Vibrio aestuarianus]